MPRLKHEDVTDHIRKSLAAPGKMIKISDGQNLILIARNGRGYWSYQFRDGMSARTKVLGNAPEMSPAKARQAREKLAVQRRDGTIARRGIVNRMAHVAPGMVAGKLFGEVLELFLLEFAPTWTDGNDGREAKAYRRTLAGSDFAKLPVADIQTKHVEAMLKQFNETPVTAEKVLVRVGKVLDYAIAKQYRSGDNPARIKGLFEYLARPVVPEPEHHPALPSADVPKLMRELKALGSIEAKALAFTILTAARTKESIRAKWKEIEGNVWTCPSDRMKGKPGKRVAHSVPLSPAVLKLLGKRGAPDDYIFPSRRGPRIPLWKSAMQTGLMTSLRPDYTVHGMRSTFRDWAAEAGYDRDLAERAIAHKVAGKTETAYQRSKLIELRRPMMAKWAKFAMAAQ
jgi:integrase